MTAERRLPHVLPAPPPAANPLTEAAVVALGGALGALARWAAGAAPADGSGLLATTMAVNVAGTFLLAVLPALAALRRRPLVVLFLGTGVLGGFTTFSAYAAQARSLAVSGSPTLAAAYVVGTLAACLVAAVAGRALAAATGRRTSTPETGTR